MSGTESATSARDLGSLSAAQRALVDGWLPGAVVEADLSWGLIETTVLRVASGGRTYVVKAGGPGDHHLAREIRAHLNWLAPWTTIGRAPMLVFHDSEAKIVVTQYLPGSLALRSTWADDPDVHRQAGTLLALLHGQLRVRDDGWEARANTRSLAWLDGRHRIAADVVGRLHGEVMSWPTPPAYLVPTHGDWQPRNWIIHDDVVSIIDFGRADLRPAATDFGRLAVQDFRRDPRLEQAFMEGYGTDPREPAAWRRMRIRDAIGTAAWACQVGDEEFEAQGHGMIADALAG